MYTNKLHPGETFPDIKAKLLSGEDTNLAKAAGDTNWKMVVVYRGVHCPVCTNYLNELDGYADDLSKIGVELVAVSADSKEQLKAHSKKLRVSFPIAYGLTQQQMQEMGLYISSPRSEKETDHNFPEPGLFIINKDGDLQIADISNVPFARPNLDLLLSGLRWLKDPDNNYPIRGTFRG
ncbi:peroxiredoxin family protein [Marinomonas pollencensis]|uniref:Peroxiredoxin n=1 Tax=Marinomonas pollencensis TaxID=491954 RepID=A0A3E0DJ96_9GAMM|nr:peroxiredoxin family protein [Marinomonas pollencensis]REG82140.1 peroxiredoxin [Marinomonas pollencensis]